RAATGRDVPCTSTGGSSAATAKFPARLPLTLCGDCSASPRRTTPRARPVTSRNQARGGKTGGADRGGREAQPLDPNVRNILYLHGHARLVPEADGCMLRRLQADALLFRRLVKHQRLFVG